MNKTTVEVIEDVTIALGVAISIDQIKTVLGIVLLTLEIIWILYKGIKVIVKKVRNKDYEGAIKNAKETIEEINSEVKKYGDRQDTK